MIKFFVEDVTNPIKRKQPIKNWIKLVVHNQELFIGDINFIFVSDSYILQVNQNYLDHHYFTDIITFNNNDGKSISGDLFISLDTIRRNSMEYNVSFKEELLRVMIHGILHLIGFDDTNDELQKEMTIQEDKALHLYHTKFTDK